MTAVSLSPAAMEIVAWLEAAGARWGLPAIACRVHAALYLTAEPMPAPAIAALLGMDVDETGPALEWLEAQGLVAADAAGWSTGTDPWALVLQALEERRRHELAEARAVAARWHRERANAEPQVARQAERLFDLIDDIAAIDARTRGLSSATTRRLIGLGGHAARLFDRTIGAGRRR